MTAHDDHAGPRDTTADHGEVSDSHIGFQGPAHTDVAGSFTAAIDQVNGLGFRPDFVMHSGDLTHLSTAGQSRSATAGTASTPTVCTSSPWSTP